ncbi:hypothetical protein PN466_14905 [Roseofilum reptotaenium CS-1145]|uniref:Uncharacterized protein n=1 Tax=Roseofilum reptotaenium AO1-A TaxID=1925591 RepID=A0A1L9QT36_9CYAN|nr:hypothetical protein [Roseofilum reptotaenium]MDB9518236.1 hypothetical protein [Roseofilum reptotaenium CS-1145]OJJ25823.1 hypothetical protein BI308_09930 [Roseofilum reptotaenium AO1-A]
MLRNIDPLWKAKEPSFWEIGDCVGDFLITGKTYCIQDGDWLYTAVPRQYDGFTQLIDCEADLHTVGQLRDLIEEEGGERYA